MLIGSVVDRAHVFELLLLKLVISFKVFQNTAIRSVDLVSWLVDGKSRTDEEGEKSHRPDVVRFDAVLDELLEVSHSFQLEVCLLGQSAKESSDPLMRGVEDKQKTTHFAALFSVRAVALCG